MLLDCFIFMTILSYFVQCELPSCKKTIDSNKMRKSYFGDSFLISSLTAQLMNRRKINKYLLQRLEDLSKLEYENEMKKLENKTSPDSSEEKCRTTVFRSCALAAKKGGSGVYLIASPRIGAKPFMTYCMTDPNGGRAWTVIQRRLSDNYIHFDRKWERYESGFGDVGHAFWLGLENIHAITYDTPQELLIEIEDTENEKRHAKYTHFAVGGLETNYTLTVLGKYKGNLGDGLRAHEGRNFATKDRVNEGAKSCIQNNGGGWWHDINLLPLCGHSNLNANVNKTHWRHWLREGMLFLEIKVAIRRIRPPIGYKN